ncbi:MAG: hypothetical protein RI894_1807 [Bacteroidota bacterium]|jgi:hypothetical protein
MKLPTNDMATNFLNKATLYPWIIAVIFLLSVLKTNYDLFLIPTLCFEIGLFLVCFLTLHFAQRMFKNKVKGAIVAAFCFLFTFFFEDIHQLYIGLYIGLPFRAKTAHTAITLLFFAGCCFALLVYILRKQPSERATELTSGLTKVNSYFNFIFIIFFGIALFKWQPFIPYTITLASPFSPQKTLERLPQKPNIYYLILDAYTGAESLRTYWQYDNTSFADSLRNLGFFVTKNAKSNYDYTYYAMASNLNASELNLCAFCEPNELYFKSAQNTLALIKESRVPQYFQKQGYKIINYSLFDVQNTPKFYSDNDLWVEKNNWDVYLGKTLLMALWNNLCRTKSIADEAAEVLYPNQEIFNQFYTDSLYQQEQPFFLYAHILMPHAPVCFDENGDKIDVALSAEQQYLAQLKYTNKLTLKALKHILKNDKTNPIILLQGDHGYRFFKALPLNDRRKEAHSIFSAYRVPDVIKQQLNDSIKTINVFRLF